MSGWTKFSGLSFPRRQLASLGKQLSKAGQQRLQWVLFYFFKGRNAARTCRHFGISRQTFYRWTRLRRWEHTYNCVRPYQSLAYLTPLEFLRRWKQNHGKAKCH